MESKKRPVISGLHWGKQQKMEIFCGQRRRNFRLVDTTGQPLQLPGMLQGVKLLQTSQLPINQTVGTSADCSEIYLGDFTKLCICMRESLNVQVLTETYAGNGQIGFMCHARVDLAVQYPQAFCVVSGVR